MRRLAALRARLEDVEGLERRMADLEALVEILESEGDAQYQAELEEQKQEFEALLRKLEVQTLFSGEFDDRDAILEISAGVGGTEACDWAQMLLRMYIRWAERNGFQTELLSETPGEVAGIRSATLAVSGPFAYGMLRSEHGVHRLVRISPFDAGNRRHTSFAMVQVLPKMEEQDVEINPDELRIETYRSSGAGGQHVNKTESAVRIIHIPTGISASCQNERSQHQNKANALAILASRLAQYQREQRAERLSEIRGDLTSADWGKQIRSYVMHPYQMVKDLRTNHETPNVNRVLDGEIEEFIEAYLRDPSVSRVS
jgi:peptide chain release factor 2